MIYFKKRHPSGYFVALLHSIGHFSDAFSSMAALEREDAPLPTFKSISAHKCSFEHRF